MIASAHLAVGSAAALIAANKLPDDSRLRIGISFAAGVASHLILDAFPHQEYAESWPWPVVIIETLAVFFFVGFAKYKSVKKAILAGMVGAAIPDLLILFPYGILRSLHEVLHVFHGSIPAFTVSMFWQSILTCLTIAYTMVKSTADS